jgi:hypothetical protein
LPILRAHWPHHGNNAPDRLSSDILLIDQFIVVQFRSIPVFATLELFQDIDLEDEFCLREIADGLFHCRRVIAFALVQ